MSLPLIVVIKLMFKELFYFIHIISYLIHYNFIMNLSTIILFQNTYELKIYSNSIFIHVHYFYNYCIMKF
jgi:hypothetical protein